MADWEDKNLEFDLLDVLTEELERLKDELEELKRKGQEGQKDG
jgi:hypothetical protein